MQVLDELLKFKVLVLFGMFGCGKTELSINIALNLAKQHKTALADIDTISPYYRSRDEKKYLEEKGIKVITPPPKLMHADLPIIVPQVGGFIQNPEYKVVLDVGGNEDGATVLGSLNNFISQQEYAGLFVVNERRPFSSDVKDIIRNIEVLSGLSRTKIHYIVNNTNLSYSTDERIIEEGEILADELYKETDIPVLCTVVPEFLNEYRTKYPKFVLKKHLKNVWEI